MWRVGGVVPMAAGAWVFVPSPHHVLLLCCLLQGLQEGKRFRLSLAGALGRTGSSDRAAGCSWGVPLCRGARVEVGRVWGVEGVVSMTAGGVGLRAFTASCSFALLSLARASGRETVSAVSCRSFRKDRVFGSGCWLLLGSAIVPRCAC